MVPPGRRFLAGERAGVTVGTGAILEKKDKEIIFDSTTILFWRHRRKQKAKIANLPRNKILIDN